MAEGEAGELEEEILDRDIASAGAVQQRRSVPAFGDAVKLIGLVLLLPWVVNWKSA